ncbi:hypothetical protein BDV39DRAFT_182393 [Aspergillus sergii]|uniref:Uncharacterized protein n=1 Tax=Aspergillus sergii TaxID=1034303 RepID=A0A5N6WRH1_9EURO|nr:hypothetical protein BDV39DRAFT_182393 [Aspergillus sergii]
MRQCWQILAIIIRYYFIFHGLWSIWTQPIPAVTTDNVASNVLSPFDSHTPLDSPDACRWTRNMLLALGWGYKKKKTRFLHPLNKCLIFKVAWCPVNSFYPYQGQFSR